MTDSRGACGVRPRSGAGRWGKALGGVLVTAAFVVFIVLPAFASTAPHVVSGDTPEACAMCHRGHTAPGVVERAEVGSWNTTGSALVVTAPSDAGDTALCYACHGVDALGSGTNVQSAFTADSAHSLAPAPSAFGPSPKQCSSCHDVHGTARTDAEEPFTALLRSRTFEGVEFYEGEEFCATCHFEAREESRFRGLEVYRDTAHFTIDATSTGTAITCSI